MFRRHRWHRPGRFRRNIGRYVTLSTGRLRRRVTGTSEHFDCQQQRHGRNGGNDPGTDGRLSAGDVGSRKATTPNVNATCADQRTERPALLSSIMAA
jgi:hypothetical protein